MKEWIYQVLAIISWLCFFTKISENWPFPWSLIVPLVGCLALYCTVKLMKSEAGPGKRVSNRGGLAIWIAALLGSVFLWEISLYVPPYWPQLFPLLAIVAIFCISTVWPDHKPEEEPEDALAQKNPGQGV
jgi:hypothetical protein